MTTDLVMFAYEKKIILGNQIMNIIDPKVLGCVSVKITEQ